MMTFKCSRPLAALAFAILALPATGLAADAAVQAGDSLDGSATAVTAADAPRQKNAAEPWVLYAEQWDMTRSGARVLALPVLQSVIHAWLEDRSRIIEIRYPGGEEGEFWVQELADWLVSLGIPSKQMIITPGSGGDDMIKFALRRA